MKNSQENLKEKLNNDPDFIISKRYDNSVEKMLERYPDGAPDHLIALVLGITEEELDVIYQNIVQKLKTNMVGEE